MSSGNGRFGPNRCLKYLIACVVQAAISLGLSILKAVFSINRRSIDVGKQPALCLGQVQVDGSRLATGDQELPDILHVNARLVFDWKLLQRDECRCQCFRNNPFVVAGNSFPRHSDRPPAFANPAMRRPAVLTDHRHRDEPTRKTRSHALASARSCAQAVRIAPPYMICISAPVQVSRLAFHAPSQNARTCRSVAQVPVGSTGHPFAAHRSRHARLSGANADPLND
jgi:hypothetical protein